MIRTSFFQFAFCFVLIIGLSCSFAFAEEVKLTPSDDWTIKVFFENNTDEFYIQTDSLVDSPSNHSANQYWLGGNFLTDSASKVAYLDPYASSSDFSFYNPGSYIGLNKLFQTYRLTTNDTVIVPSFELTFSDSSLSLDVSSLTPGYYRYEADFYLGIGGGQNQVINSYASFDPVFTYITDSVPCSSGSMVYLGTEDFTINDSSNGIASKFVHLYFEDTWYIDPTLESYEWNLTPGFQYLISSLQYNPALSLSKNRMVNVTTNFRISSRLYGNVNPPITPTPSPTPYPGQDTQESINSGVQQIVTDLNISATPIPAPSELAIDETIFDVLETMTLPDISEAETSFTDLWSIFDPLWVFLGALFGSLTVVGIFLYFVRGGFV